MASLCLPHIAQAQPAVIAAVDPNPGAVCDVFSEGRLVARLGVLGLSETYPSDPGSKQYIIDFKAVEAVALHEASYEVLHPVLGRLQLFLQPSGTLNIDQHDGRHYRACMAMLA